MSACKMEAFRCAQVAVAGAAEDDGTVPRPGDRHAQLARALHCSSRVSQKEAKRDTGVSWRAAGPSHAPAAIVTFPLGKG